MADSEVEKVGIEGGGGGDGGQQPDTKDALTQTQTETQDNVVDTHDAADTHDAGIAPDDASTGQMLSNDAGDGDGDSGGDSDGGDGGGGGGGGGDSDGDSGGEASGGRTGKDNSKVDFPIADAQYRDKDGNVVTAVSVDAGAGKDGADVVKLIAVPRPIFDEDGEIDEATGKKPVLYAGWNHRKHNPLKKGDFVNEDEFVKYQAFTYRIKAAVFMEKAKVAETRAVRLKKFGNEQQRKDVNKALKMREALKKYEKMLEEQGIDLGALDD